MFDGLLSDLGFSSLPEGWRIEELNDVCNGVFDCPHSTPKLSDEGPYLVRTQDIRNGFFDTEQAVKVSEETYLDRIKRAEPSAGDLLFSREGTYFGDAAEVPENTQVCLGQRMVLIRPKQEVVRSKFLRIWINSSVFQRYLLRFRDGTVAERLNLSVIRKLPVLIPDLNYQAWVEQNIVPIEEKQSVNRQANQTLEHIAQAIFKSWFVDFDPTRAKIAAKQAGQDPECAAMAAISGKPLDALDSLQQTSPEQYEQLKTTAALFTDTLVDSEFGEIPVGWEFSALDKFVQFQNGYAFKSKDWTEEGIPVVKIGSVKPGLVDLSNSSFVSSETVVGLDRYKLGAGDLLVGMSGYPGETGLVPISDVQPYLNQRVGKISPIGGDKNLHAWLYCVIRDPAFKTYAETRAHGSAQANVSGKALMEFLVAFPGERLVEALGNAISPMIKKYLLLSAESNKLEAIRNKLLPELLAGNIKPVE